MAYADHLTEIGDSRGEFIQVQLALDDPGRSPGERRRLHAREKELLEAHQREWLGETADFFLLDEDGLEDLGDEQEHFNLDYLYTAPFDFLFSRGWLEH